MNTCRLWIDSHVHIYPIFSLNTSLDSAIHAFKRETSQYNASNFSNNKIKNIYVLCLNECEKEKAHYRISQLPQNMTSHSAHWIISKLSFGLFMAKKGADEIYLYLGRQRVSKEGIELLTLGNSKINSGDLNLTLGELIKRYSNAIPVLPWGFGKWIGMRGKIVSDCISDPELNKDLWVGDSRTRPKLWFYVPQFNMAFNKGVPRFAGSDPLPLKDQEKQICLFGNMFELHNSAELRIESADHMTGLIKSFRMSAGLQGRKYHQFGRPSGLIHSLCNQIKLRQSK